MQEVLVENTKDAAQRFTSWEQCPTCKFTPPLPFSAQPLYRTYISPPRASRGHGDLTARAHAPLAPPARARPRGRRLP